MFTFLEDGVGCRWWTPTESAIPSTPTLTIGAQNTCRLGTFAVSPAMGFWSAPAENPDSVKGISVDRVFAIAEGPAPAVNNGR